jgi:hypothetical protein
MQLEREGYATKRIRTDTTRFLETITDRPLRLCLNRLRRNWQNSGKRYDKWLALGASAIRHCGEPVVHDDHDTERFRPRLSRRADLIRLERADLYRDVDGDECSQVVAEYLAEFETELGDSQRAGECGDQGAGAPPPPHTPDRWDPIERNSPLGVQNTPQKTGDANGD